MGCMGCMLYQLVWQVLLLFQQGEDFYATTTASNVHNAILQYGLLLTTMLIHNVLMSLFQQQHLSLDVSTVGPCAKSSLSDSSQENFDPDDANNNSIVADVHGDDEDAEEEGPSDNNNKIVTNPTSQHYGQQQL
jgi:hypothetical protein